MARSKQHSENLSSAAQDVWSLVLGYAKQEIVEPIKGVGRFLAFGLLGAVVLSVGLLLLLLGGLRLVQEESGDTFDEGLSWVPYLFIVVACALVLAVVMKTRSRGQKRRRKES